MKILRKLPGLLIAGFILFMPAARVVAQYTAKQIVFNHPGSYTQAQLEAAAGMHPGMSFKTADLDLAAQRLIDTGFFETVGGTLAGMTNAATVLFDVKPIERAEMLHAGFENFVWLTHAEIEDALHTKSPLFLDYLPENSPLQDVFDAALTEALLAKGIKARVEHDTIEPTMLRPERSVEFRVATPAIRVANVKLSGVTAELAPLIQKSVNSVAHTPYNEGLAGQTTADRILAPLLDAGYLNASLSDVIAVPTLSENDASVVLAAMLDARDIYRVAGITFAGTPLFSADAFAATQKLHPGDIASRAVLMETLAPLDAAYRGQGYVDVAIKATPTTDAATHQVAYTITVQPGDVYHFAEVTTNLPPAMAAQFNAAWKLQPKSTYDGNYLVAFLKLNAAQPYLRAYSISWKIVSDPNTHEVAVNITFLRN